MDQPNWIERLASSTRLRVFELLLRSELTVQEVADDVGISANAIRGHLAALERDGLVVQSGTRRDTGGKPAAIYTASRDADEVLPKAYAFVLQRLLGVLDERFGGDAVREALEEVGTRAAAPAAGSPEERVEAAAAALRGIGGKVEVRRLDDRFRIQGFACPLSSVARDDARVCGLAEALVQRTTGGVVREVCERTDRPRCAFEIQFAGGTGEARA